MSRRALRRLTLTAVFLALGIVLPFVTGWIPAVGKMLLPMHIPVMLCGLVCGPVWGLGLGLSLPLLRSALFSMPPVWPDAVGMTFELAAYGLVIGLVFRRFRRPGIGAVYASLGIAMLAGRLVWGAARTVLLGFGGADFSFEIFFAAGFVRALPGILLQLVLIPALMMFLSKTGVLLPENNKNKNDR